MRSTLSPADIQSPSAKSPLLRVAAFTGSETISSRRFRVQQLVDSLAAHGIEVHEFVARYGAWPPLEHWKRPFWLLATTADRIVPTVRSRQYDLTFLQREFVSTLFTLERFTGRPRVLDVDDAVWLNGSRADANFATLARACDAVVCGNDYIAGIAGQWNARTVVLPTAVDTNRFRPAARVPRSRKIIGWSGLHAGSKYLLGIEEALYRVLRARPDTVLRVVSDAMPAFGRLTVDMVEFIPWSPDNEVRTIQEMDIGLMPIDDTEWSKGKCSYKMLLYMACGVPVVVSPYGMNVEVLAHAAIGLGPRTADEWSDAIVELLDDEREREILGANARRVVEENYSLAQIGPRLAQFLLTFRST